MELGRSLEKLDDQDIDEIKMWVKLTPPQYRYIFRTERTGDGAGTKSGGGRRPAHRRDQGDNGGRFFISYAKEAKCM